MVMEKNSYGLFTMMMDYLIIFFRFFLRDSSKQQSKFLTGKGYTFKSQMAPINLPVEFLFTQQTRIRYFLLRDYGTASVFPSILSIPCPCCLPAGFCFTVYGN